MSSGNNIHAAKATPPTEEELFYRTWAYETLKANIITAQEALKLLISINVALLGGGIAFFYEIVIPEWFRIVLHSFFFLSLIVTLFGIYPVSSVVDYNNVEEIKEHKSNVLNKKRLYLKLAAFLTVLGLLCCIVAVSGARLYL